MRRVVLSSFSRPDHRQATKEIRTKRPAQIQIFVKTVNKELEEIEELILESKSFNSQEIQEKR
jgi:hypothetical protein